MLPSTEADQCVFVMWNVVCGYSVGLLQILPRRGEHHGGVDQPDRGSLSPEWQQRQLHRYLWLIKHFFTCVITSVRWGFSKYLCERSEKNEQGIWGKNRLKMKQERFIWAEELLTQQKLLTWQTYSNKLLALICLVRYRHYGRYLPTQTATNIPTFWMTKCWPLIENS